MMFHSCILSRCLARSAWQFKFFFGSCLLLDVDCFTIRSCTATSCTMTKNACECCTTCLNTETYGCLGDHRDYWHCMHPIFIVLPEMVVHTKDQSYYRCVCVYVSCGLSVHDWMYVRVNACSVYGHWILIYSAERKRHCHCWPTLM